MLFAVDVMQNKGLPVKVRTEVGSLLQAAFLQEDILGLASHDPSHTLTKLVAAHESIDPPVLVPLVKAVSLFNITLNLHNTCLEYDPTKFTSHYIFSYCFS
jgi:hypothetical protein